MRPIKLELENVGPFFEKASIDFSHLGDMFLICGDTGAGKSTILDAMCYALYGKLPGSHNPHTRTIRSDFATPQDVCSISFEFKMGSDIYKVVRCPPSAYSNKKGIITEKLQQVELYQKIDGSWNNFPGKTTEIDEKLIKLIGLSVDEFSRIVLLPQGDFAEFLRLSSNDRKEALSKLFPVRDYKAITEFAVSKDREYRQKLAHVEAQIHELQKTFNSEDAAQNAKTLQEEIEAARQKRSTLQVTLDRQNREAEKAQQLYNKFTELAQKQAEYADLLKEESDIQKNKQHLEKAGFARNVKPKYDAWESCRKQTDDIHKQLEDAEQTFTNLQSTEIQLSVRKEAIDNLRNNTITLQQNIKDLQKALGEEQLLQQSIQDEARAEQQKEMLNQQLQEIEEQLAPLTKIVEDAKPYTAALSTYIDDDEKATAQLEKALKDAENTKKYQENTSKIQTETELLESARNNKKNLSDQKQLLQQEITLLKQKLTKNEHNNMAFTLSQTLTDDVPCPVCGSVHHPALATAVNSNVMTIQEKINIKEEMLADCDKDLQNADIKIAKHTSFITTWKEQLDTCGTPVTDAADILKKAAENKQESKGNLDTAKRVIDKCTNAEKKRKNLLDTQEPIKSQLKDAEKAYIEATTKRDQFKIQLNNLTAGKVPQDKTVLETINESNQTISKNENTISAYEKKTEENIKALSLIQGTISTLKKNKDKSIKALSDADDTLQTCLVNNNFTSMNEMLLCCLNSAQELHLKNQIEQWDSEKQRLLTLIDNLKKELVSDTPPDIATAEQAVKNITISLNETNEHLQNLTTQKSNLDIKQEQWDKLTKDHLELSQNSAAYINLANDLSGNNSRKLSFESWILGVYLEEITIHATKRLERISNGRFKLLLNSETMGRQKYSGLDLEIFDANTGKKRPCETLSGGETFLVSISLALALTDVVQSKSGGIQLDSLFIDEGFGTLDEVMLEKALSILDEIRGARTIGLISHVGELKNRIPSRIEVRKSTTGSSLSIVR